MKENTVDITHISRRHYSTLKGDFLWSSLFIYQTKKHLKKWMIAEKSGLNQILMFQAVESIIGQN